MASQRLSEPWGSLQRRPCGRTSPPQAPSLAASHHHGLLTPPLAAAMAACGRAVPRAESTHDRSVQRPSPASVAASAWPSRGRGWAQAGAEVGVSWREVNRNAQFLAVCRRSKWSKHLTNSPLLALRAMAGSKAACRMSSACSHAFWCRKFRRN